MSKTSVKPLVSLENIIQKYCQHSKQVKLRLTKTSGGKMVLGKTGILLAQVASA